METGRAMYYIDEPEFEIELTADEQEAEEPADAAEWAAAELGFEAEAAQRRVLTSGARRVILNCTRQWGKSTVTAAKAVHEAMTRPGSLTVAVSPSARQSAELVRKAEQQGDVDFLREGVRVLSQALMEVEVSQQLGAERYERTAERTGQRNGYREREWDTRVGTIDLQVPKLREGTYFPAWLLTHRRRAEQALASVVAQAYVEGVSTRRVEDLVEAMGIAGIVNMSMLVIAAAVFHENGLTEVGGDLAEVADQLGVHLGHHADILFGIALLASGLSSSSVGTLAGQVVMQGFIRRRIPLFLRRAITMAPALIIIAAGVDASRALVLSQVALSFGIPFALIPLLWFCRDRELMGSLVNRRATTVVTAAIATVIVCLNVFLLEQTLL